MNTTQTAAAVRAAIKSAVKSGALPAATYSVRTRYASLMSEIDITVTDAPFCAYSMTDARPNVMRAVVYTHEAAQLEATIREMVRAAGYRADDRHSFISIEIDREERSALFVFVEAERSGQIARAA